MNGEPLNFAGTGHPVCAAGLLAEWSSDRLGYEKWDSGVSDPINNRGPLQKALTLPMTTHAVNGPQALGPPAALEFLRGTAPFRHLVAQP